MEDLKDTDKTEESEKKEDSGTNEDNSGQKNFDEDGEADTDENIQEKETQEKTETSDESEETENRLIHLEKFDGVIIEDSPQGGTYSSGGYSEAYDVSEMTVLEKIEYNTNVSSIMLAAACFALFFTAGIITANIVFGRRR